MRTSVMTLLVGLAAAVAVPAQAELPAAVWASAYRPLPVPEGGPVEILQLEDGRIFGHLLPEGFLFHLGGSSYDKLNIGEKGYVTFGNSSTTHRVDWNDAQRLLTSESPANVLAAWWGDHFCDVAGRDMRTQVVGEAPNRWFVIEWHCSRRGDGNRSSGSLFETQLWLLEGSPIARVKYGDLILMGPDWNTVSWGVKEGSAAGVLGPSREGSANSCNPAGSQGSIPKCQANVHFPRYSTIQYGLSEEADLTATLSPGDVSVSATRINFSARTTVKNLGHADVVGATFDLYLSVEPAFEEGRESNIFLTRTAASVDVSGGGSTMVNDSISVGRPPNGVYWLCAVLDPEKTVTEFDRSNNEICASKRVPIGPDLIGEIEAPLTGSSNERVEVPIKVENVGNAASGAFNYLITIEPEEFSEGGKARSEKIYVGRIARLGVGESQSMRLDIPLPETIRGDEYTFILTLDVDEEVAEADRSNNVSYSVGRMENRKPRMSFPGGAFEPYLPDGCYFGERIEATFEICNTGRAEALNFRPGVAMGTGDLFSILNDVPSATFPQACLSPGHPSHTSCEPVEGITPSCVAEACRISCETTEDCPGDLVCGLDSAWATIAGDPSIKSCMNRLTYPGSGAGGQTCKTFQVSGTIPLADQDGVYYQDGDYNFHLVDDISYKLSQNLPAMVSTPERACREALPDLATGYISAPQRAVAGKAMVVTRSIRNLGFIERPRDGSPRPDSIRFGYRYFLSLTPNVSLQQIPVEVQSTGGAGTASIGRKGENILSELLMVPSHLEPGEYYLGLILDSEGEVRELSRSNNAYVVPTPILVERASLQLVTEQLPMAVVGSPYRHALVAGGGAGALSWSAEDLPPGLSLGADGVLAGTPADDGIFRVAIKVTSGSISAARRLALRVLPPTSQLEVTSSYLPSALRNEPYGVWVDELGTKREGLVLAASGGLPPYHWELDPTVEGNRLPEGLSGPSAEGRITGRATTQSVGTTFWVRVRDRLGQVATKELSIPVVGNADLAITSRLFSEGRTATPYDSCIQAAGGDRSANYSWDVDRDELPPGLWVQVRGDELCLVGAPSECRNYQVRATVTDARGQSYTARIPLSITCESIRANSRTLGEVARGQEVRFDLGSRATEGASWRIILGWIPEGLSLSELGILEGVVAGDAAAGPYDFAVEIRDIEGRIGHSALSITVQVEPQEGKMVTKKVKSSGCASSGGTEAGLGAAALAFLAVVHRRRQSGGCGAGGSISLGLPVLGIAFAISLIAIAACGGDEEVSYLDRCVEVSCTGGLVCDPEDGACKCGDVPCKDGEICVLEPTPQCTTSLCEFVICERGESCEPETGDCSCGGGSCAQGEICIAGRCEVDGSLSEKICGEGLELDPADELCKCGGIVCEQTQRCVDQECVTDLCAGVHCGPNSNCDPADGVCRCPGPGGQVCGLGELCLPEGEGFICGSKDPCEGVACGGGMSCDPSDGLCHCPTADGPGPVCYEGQTCFDGECRGGFLCAPGGEPVQCGPRLVCDEADGLCKCGGEVCGEGEHCVQQGGALGCARECDPFLLNTGCPRGLGCYYDQRVVEGVAFCAAPGRAARDFVCEISTDCQEGLYCSSAGRCRLPCDLRQPECSSVSSSAICGMIPGAPANFGVCIEG